MFAFGEAYEVTVCYGTWIDGFPTGKGLMLPRTVVQVDLAPCDSMPNLRMPEVANEPPVQPTEFAAFKLADEFYGWTEQAGTAVTLQLLATGDAGIDCLESMKQCSCQLKQELQDKARQALLVGTYAKMIATCPQERTYREVRELLSRQERMGTVERVVLSREMRVWQKSEWAG